MAQEANVVHHLRQRELLQPDEGQSATKGEVALADENR